MELRRNGFWAVLYRDCRMIWLDFAHGKPEPRFFETDLCTFVRTIFVWAPLALLMNAAVAIFMLGTAMDFIWMLFLNAATVGMVVLVVAVIAALFGAVLGALRFTDVVQKVVENSETAHLAAEYLKAKKTAVCPLITMKEDTSDAAA